MNHARRFQSAVGAVVALGVWLLAAGCKPNAERDRVRQLEEFRNRMEEVDAAIIPGMAYSNLIAQLGEPFVSRTNGGSITSLYYFSPRIRGYDPVTNNFIVDVSNGVVIGKTGLTSAWK